MADVTQAIKMKEKTLHYSNFKSGASNSFMQTSKQFPDA